MTSDPPLRRLLEVASAAADAAGRRAMHHFRGDPQTHVKTDGSPVTIADREAEAAMRATILEAFPTHSILGEEEGDTVGTAPYRWILDPIDGTESFVRGVPLFGALVGVEREGEMLAGVCHMPAIGETVAAAKGLGSRWNGRLCHVSAVTDLSQAFIVSTSPRALRRRTQRYLQLEDQALRTRGWSDCYAYLLVATGRADLALDPVMKPWDAAPFVCILPEAGGRFTDWRGNVTAHGGDAIASNGHLHDAALALLGTAPPSE